MWALFSLMLAITLSLLAAGAGWRSKESSCNDFLESFTYKMLCLSTFSCPYKLLFSWQASMEVKEHVPTLYPFPELCYEIPS